MGASLNPPLQGRSRYKRRLMWTGFIFVLPALTHFLLIHWYPLIEAFQMSFQEVQSGMEWQFVGLQTYREVFGDSAFWRSFANTMTFTAITVTTTVGLALVISIAISNVKFQKAQNVFTLVYILPTLVSFAAAALIWEWIYHPRFGLANQALRVLGVESLPAYLASEAQVIPSIALIHAWVRMGFAVVILLAGLQSIPTTYFDAARVDGTRGLQIYRYITIPLLLPHLGAVTLLELIFSLKIFDEVYVTTQGGPNGASMVVMVYLYNNAFRYYRPDRASVAAVTIFLVLAALSIVQRRLVKARDYEY